MTYIRTAKLMKAQTRTTGYFGDYLFVEGFVEIIRKVSALDTVPRLSGTSDGRADKAPCNYLLNLVYEHGCDASFPVAPVTYLYAPCRWPPSARAIAASDYAKQTCH